MKAGVLVPGLYTPPTTGRTSVFLLTVDFFLALTLTLLGLEVLLFLDFPFPVLVGFRFPLKMVPSFVFALISSFATCVAHSRKRINPPPFTSTARKRLVALSSLSTLCNAAKPSLPRIW